MGNIREETVDAINLMESYTTSGKAVIEVHFTDKSRADHAFILSPEVNKLLNAVTNPFKMGQKVSTEQMKHLRRGARVGWVVLKDSPSDKKEFLAMSSFGKAIKRASETIMMTRGSRKLGHIVIGYKRNPGRRY